MWPEDLRREASRKHRDQMLISTPSPVWMSAELHHLQKAATVPDTPNLGCTLTFCPWKLRTESVTRHKPAGNVLDFLLRTWTQLSLQFYRDSMACNGPSTPCSWSSPHKKSRGTNHEPWLSPKGLERQIPTMDIVKIIIKKHSDMLIFVGSLWGNVVPDICLSFPLPLHVRMLVSIQIYHDEYYQHNTIPHQSTPKPLHFVYCTFCPCELCCYLSSNAGNTSRIYG